MSLCCYCVAIECVKAELSVKVKEVSGQVDHCHWCLENACIRSRPEYFDRPPGLLSWPTQNTCITHPNAMSMNGSPIPGHAILFAFRAGSRLREGPFHYLGGGAGRLFQIIFFQLMLKLDFFFHTIWSQFFTKNWRSEFFFLIVLLRRQLFLPLCWSDNYFFLQHIKAEKKFQHTSWAKLLFWAKSRTRLFFQKVFQPTHPR